MPSFDLVVIGTGTAASTIAGQCRGAGWSVAVVDSLPFGGTCALRGCDPKKVLVGAADAVNWVRAMQERGIDSPGVRIDWPALMHFKRSFTGPVPHQKEQSFEHAGIISLHGRARFSGAAAITVDGASIEARHFAIATGARPASLKIPGEDLVIKSDQFLELEYLPDRVVFIGGGYIAFEFAHVAARAGAQVTVLHRGKRALEGFDSDLVRRLVDKSRALGIDVQLETAVTAVERHGAAFTVRAGAKAFDADLVVHAAGRVPDLDDLDLRAAGVEFGPKGVRVNEYLQSVSNPAVYAAGDAADSGNPALTPVAGYEGRVAAANLLRGNGRKLEKQPIPSVVFTIPPLASVGISEAQAKAARCVLRDTSGWYSSRRVGEDCSGSKVLIDEATDLILGAHLLGPQAEELINVFAVAIRCGLKAADLKEMIFAYPTHGSDLQYML